MDHKQKNLGQHIILNQYQNSQGEMAGDILGRMN